MLIDQAVHAPKWATIRSEQTNRHFSRNTDTFVPKFPTSKILVPDFATPQEQQPIQRRVLLEYTTYTSRSFLEFDPLDEVVRTI